MERNLRMYYSGRTPTRAYNDDAGLDLYVDGDQTVKAHGLTDVSLGVSVKAPEGTWVLLTGRSSTLKKRGIRVEQGIIDTGYTGPLYATVVNTTDDDIHLNDGERIAQLIVMPNLTQRTNLIPVDILPPTERGDQGFGSSGR